MQQCQLSFGWLVQCGRHNDGLTQKGLCSILLLHYGILLNPEEIEAIEQNVVKPQEKFLESICELFELDSDWVRQIYQLSHY